MGERAWAMGVRGEKEDELEEIKRRLGFNEETAV